MINKARAIHHILMGGVVAGATVLATALSKIAVLNLAQDPTVRTLIVGVIGTMASAGIGIAIAEFMNDPTPPNTPNS